MRLPEVRIGNKVATVPIIQGGMAIRITTARLAAAAANEGRNRTHRGLRHEAAGTAL